MHDPGEKVLVIIPTYNEVENIGETIARVRRAIPSVDILVVDDGSPDGTDRRVEEIAAREPDRVVSLLRRQRKEGLGSAYIAGFLWGIDRKYDVLVEMDADGSHRPEELHALLEAAQRADAVVGSRWVSGGTVVNWPRRRHLLSRAANLYARYALRIGIKDITAGYRAYRRSALEQIELSSVTSQGYAFQIDLTRRVVAHGLQIVEVPVQFIERERGLSKMSSAIIREAFIRVTTWGWHAWFGRASE